MKLLKTEFFFWGKWVFIFKPHQSLIEKKFADVRVKSQIFGPGVQISLNVLVTLLHKYCKFSIFAFFPVCSYLMSNLYKLFANHSWNSLNYNYIKIEIINDSIFAILMPYSAIKIWDLNKVFNTQNNVKVLILKINLIFFSAESQGTL